MERRLTPEQTEERAGRLRELFARCEVCPWACRVDRRIERSGKCGMGTVPVVSSANLHRGEEPPLSGLRGSGTIFLAGCNLACRFCQNWPISHLRHGEPASIEELAGMMLTLERRGAHNVNLVTPTHFTPQIVEAVARARRGGLSVPLVWNSNGYERVEALRLLDGVVEIYLPDLKYADDEHAAAFSGAKDYWATATAAIAEMNRQVGRLVRDECGIAVRGLIIRHLVLPGGLSGTRRVLQWVAEHLPPGTALSLMGQYFPAGEAVGDRRIGRKLSPEEYADACALLDEFPEIEGWTQDMSLPGGC
ncbi:MAG: radical SAM protein [Deltaproteobacteria bacterium]|nr:radical SAM protein [Deltaproteobacteria bacterium]